MKKLILIAIMSILAFTACGAFGAREIAWADGDSAVLADTTSYTVQPGDSMWKIAVRYEIGISELIAANPQISNSALIYVGQKITIPNATPLKSVEDEIIRLVNVQRSYNGLQPLTYNWQAARVARYKSEDMIKNNYFAHISPVYGSPFKMMESFGLKFSAGTEKFAIQSAFLW